MPGTRRQGWARLGAAVADQVVVTTVQDMHRAITDSAFRWVGPVGRPVQGVHDAVVGRAYGAVRATVQGVGDIAAAMGPFAPDAPPTQGAIKARAIAVGVVDDHVRAEVPELDLDVTLRHDGAPVATNPPALRAAHPDARGRVVVFVHGLVDTEAVWTARSDSGGLPGRARISGATPVLVRYGTGRAIADNGRALADVLDAIVTNWPVPIVELVVVAHSMGGLVVRAACDVGGQHRHAWPHLLSDIVYLGTPHLGAWLEKFANVTSWTLRRSSATTAPIGALLDARSRGIKDLRFGTLDDDAWHERGIDDLLSGLAPDTPWLGGVRHHVVVGRLRPRHGHPLNLVFGDLMVREASATGSGRWRRIDGADDVTVHLVAAPHGRLVDDQQVAQLVDRVLQRPA